MPVVDTITKPSTLVSRTEWGALAPKGDLPPMEHPSDTINLTLENIFGPCRSKDECSNKVRVIQKFFMEDMNLLDIPYNFLVGNDGNVYEGRGWNVKPGESQEGTKLADRTLDIALIGGSNNVDFSHSDGVDERVEVARNFVLENVKTNLIIKDYDVTGVERRPKDDV